MNNPKQELPLVATGSSGVYLHLKETILNGQYGYNERLPPERELAAIYDVARGTRVATPGAGTLGADKKW